MAKHFAKSWSLQLKWIIFIKKTRKSWSYVGAEITSKVLNMFGTRPNGVNTTKGSRYV